MRFTLFLTIFTFQLSFLAQEKTNSLEIKEIKSNYFLFTTYKLYDNVPFPSNGLYVVGDSAIVMIDTPWNSEQLQSLLDSIELKHHKKVTHCLSTHFHDDRTIGLEYYKAKGVKTYSSVRTKELCILRKEKVAEFSFTKDTVFQVSGLKFETFYPGKGHTEDNILIYFPAAKLLYGGCFVKSLENKSLGFIGDAYLKDWKKSVKKVIKKYPEAEIVIPGHFAHSDTKALHHTLKLLKEKHI